MLFPEEKQVSWGCSANCAFFRLNPVFVNPLWSLMKASLAALTSLQIHSPARAALVSWAIRKQERKEHYVLNYVLNL